MAFILNLILLMYGIAVSVYRPYENNEINKF